MPFAKFDVSVLVDSSQKSRVSEHFENCVDALVRDRIPIFDSYIHSTTVCEAKNADEIRQEMS